MLLRATRRTLPTHPAACPLQAGAAGLGVPWPGCHGCGDEGEAPPHTRRGDGLNPPPRAEESRSRRSRASRLTFSNDNFPI